MFLKNEMFYKNTLKLYNTEYFLCSLDIYLAARSPSPILVIPNFLFFLNFIFTLFYFTILYWFCHTLT